MTPAARIIAACGAAAVAGVVVGRAAGPVSWWPALAVILALVPTLSVARGAVRHGALAVAALALAGLARGAPSTAPEAPVPDRPGAATFTGDVRDVPTLHRGSSVVLVDISAPSGSPPVGTVAVQVRGRSPLLPGDSVRLSTSGLRRPTTRPGPLSVTVLDHAGVTAVASGGRVTLVRAGSWWRPDRVTAVARAAVTARLAAELPSPAAEFSGDVAVGARAPLPVADDRALRRAGLVHLVATSGLKVAVVAGLTGRLLATATVSPGWRRAAAAAAVCSYAALAGGGVAAFRSTITTVTGLAALPAGRRVPPLLPLTAIAGIAALADPGITTDTGYRLTMLGTLGILALAGPLAGRVRGPRWLVEPFAVTVAAQLATLPVQAASFGMVSLVGPLANALAVPLVAPLLAGALLGSALSVLSPELGLPGMLLAGIAARGILAIADLAAALPFAAISLPALPAAAIAGIAVLGAALVAATRLMLTADA